MDVLTKTEVYGCVFVCVCPVWGVFQTLNCFLPELELETLNIRERTGRVECTDSLLVSKCDLDETEYDLIAFRVIHLSPFIMMERDVTHMNL